MNDTSLRWYWLGLSALGVLVGYLVTLSQSPVVGTLLPLLFALIAGVSSFVLGKTNFRSAESIQKIKYWGVGFFAFSVAFVVSSGSCIFLINTLARPQSQNITLIGVEPHAALELVGLRRKLQILGATQDEQVQLLESAKKRLSPQTTDGEKVADFVRQFAPIGQALSNELDASAADSSKLPEDIRKNLFSARAVVKATVPVLEAWLTPGQKTLQIAGVRLILSANEKVINELLGSAGGGDEILAISSRPQLVGALFQAKAMLDNNPPTLDQTRPLQADDLSSVDKLTELLLSGKITENQLFRGIAEARPPSSWSGEGV
jgi:hypothetical protein